MSNQNQMSEYIIMDTSSYDGYEQVIGKVYYQLAEAFEDMNQYIDEFYKDKYHNIQVVERIVKVSHKVVNQRKFMEDMEREEENRMYRAENGNVQ